jgi:hypothetical protein
MKSLSYFEKFTCFAALRRRLSCAQATPSFARRFIIHVGACKPANDTVARLFPPIQCSHLSPASLPSTCNPHRPASAARAASF